MNIIHPLSPQAMLRAMLIRERMQREMPGATVEVIGTDELAALKLLCLTVSERVRVEFHPIDSQGHRDLYFFMRQDPSKPMPSQFVPRLPGP